MIIRISTAPRTITAQIPWIIGYSACKYGLAIISYSLCTNQSYTSVKNNIMMILKMFSSVFSINFNIIIYQWFYNFIYLIQLIYIMRLDSKHLYLLAEDHKLVEWRRREDSNLWWSCDHTCFQDKPNKPLWHSSIMLMSFFSRGEIWLYQTRPVH